MTNILKNGDSVTQSLGKLYRKFGYSRYKMSKFEEYDTYVKNKDFLISDRVITFTDVNGKLLAMKPDVTLSIIKNTDDTDRFVHKLYYKENVYRVSNGSHAFKEIMQMGLECVGSLDAYSISEVIVLAIKSLELISESYVLDLSHMGFVSGVLNETDFTDDEKKAVLNAIGDKNIPMLKSLCDEKGISDELTLCILGLVNINGRITKVIKELSEISINDETQKALNELKIICDVLECIDNTLNVNIDFSVVNDMNYYNGLVFKGYIEGIPTGVLSGGQYDKLMAKMEKNSKALGFAVYLDLLEMFDLGKNDYDADVLICYDENNHPSEIFNTVKKYTDDDKTVITMPDTPKNIRCREIVDLTKGGSKNENC